MPDSQTGIKTTEERKAPSASAAREKFRQARKTGTAPKAAPRQPSPTRSIEPGIVHYKVAEGILRGLSQRAEAIGVTLDVGEFPNMTDVDGENSDPQRLVKLVAHAVARVGDRFTFVRKFSRHMEGQEKRAGIVSDFAAALWTLYQKNPDALESIAKATAHDFQIRRASRAANTQPNGNGVNPVTPYVNPIGGK